MTYQITNIKQNPKLCFPETYQNFKPRNLNPKVQNRRKHAETPDQATPTGTPHQKFNFHLQQATGHAYTGSENFNTKWQ